VESIEHLRMGETKNYSESEWSSELAIIDVTDTHSQRVVAVPCALLARQKAISVSGLPFTITPETYYANSELSSKVSAGFTAVKTTEGIGNDLWWREKPHETAMDKTDVPSAILEINGPRGTLGTILVSEYLGQPQMLNYDGRQYELTLRPERYYMPFSLKLLEFKHDRYPGTDIPKNFSSRVRLQRVDTGEDREVLIYMNNPLRYGGETFYQASFDPDDHGSVLQVVHNPGWLTPYLACALVGIGLLVQFSMHLIPFLKRRNS